ncbi:hypothetical protein R3W88_014481 [Solanum pinnatisectum]|uniref:PPM-type phosphatase domain-containing protein n=1 Tax=Solanum pinnatisectum TaxID=50273 RepID=A0AAV9KT68_9SOLN|nr:hypothetical protein R3W88_014481 [Solanum pinnatisectum]
MTGDRKSSSGRFHIFHLRHSHDHQNLIHLLNELLRIFLNFHDVWTNTVNVTRRAYHSIDKYILENAFELGKEGSTAITAMLINSQTLVVANVGDSRALSVDHEPNREREIIESKGGFVSNIPGDVPRIDGKLAVARAFGDKSLKRHISLDPNVAIELINNDVDLIILASDGLWKVIISNQEAVNCIKNMKDAKAATKHFIRSGDFVEKQG